MRKAKALLELNLAKDVNNEKGFKYTISKRKDKENVGLLLNEVDVLVREGTESY